MKEENPFNDPGQAVGYESWYQTTGRRADRLEKKLLGRLLDDFPRARTLLEIGCGTAHFTRWFADRGLRVIGLDHARPMLADAARRSQHPLVQGDALQLPFPDHSVDLAVLITTLEFLSPPVMALAEALRVARRGLILGVINRCSLLGMRYKRSADSPWDAARLFSPGELTCLVKEAAGTLSLEIHWRTTLFPILPHDLPLPWGGFIGLRARIPPGAISEISPETDWKP